MLDEADEMLNKGFKAQIYDVYRYLPPGIQVYRILLLCIHMRVTIPLNVLPVLHSIQSIVIQY